MEGSYFIIHHSAYTHEELQNMWRNESQALSHWIKQNKVAKFIQEVIDIHQLLRSTLHLNVNQFFHIQFLEVVIQNEHISWSDIRKKIK